MIVQVFMVQSPHPELDSFLDGMLTQVGGEAFGKTSWAGAPFMRRVAYLAGGSLAADPPMARGP